MARIKHVPLRRAREQLEMELQFGLWLWRAALTRAARTSGDLGTAAGTRERKRKAAAMARSKYVVRRARAMAREQFEKKLQSVRSPRRRAASTGGASTSRTPGKAAWTGGRAAAGGEALFASDKYGDFTLSFAPFLRLVRKINDKCSKGNVSRWTPEAILMLQKAAENYLLYQFKVALRAIHARRVALSAGSSASSFMVAPTLVSTFPIQLMSPKSVNCEDYHIILRKDLSKSDVVHKIGIMLPKKDAETNLPILNGKGKLKLEMDDFELPAVWKFEYRYYRHKGCIIYAFATTGGFVKRHGLQAKDILIIYKNKKSGRYVARAVKAEDIKVPECECIKAGKPSEKCRFAIGPLAKKMGKDIQQAPLDSDIDAQHAEARLKGNSMPPQKRRGKTIDIVLRDEPKWLIVLEDGDKTGMPKDGDKTGMPKERPIGAKEAKKQRSGKCKARDDDASLNEDLKNYIALQATTKQRHEEYLKTKKRISSDKVEAARLGRETALVKAYQKLISMDTKEMTEEMRAEHAIGLKIIRGKLDDNTN